MLTVSVKRSWTQYFFFTLSLPRCPEGSRKKEWPSWWWIGRQPFGSVKERPSSSKWKNILFWYHKFSWKTFQHLIKCPVVFCSGMLKWYLQQWSLVRKYPVVSCLQILKCHVEQWYHVPFIKNISGFTLAGIQILSRELVCRWKCPVVSRLQMWKCGLFH